MGAFDGTFELLLVTAEASSAHRERVHELLSQALQRIEQSRHDQYAELFEPFEVPLRQALEVVDSDFDQAMAYLSNGLTGYRQANVVRRGELPPRGWFVTMPKLDEPARPRDDQRGAI